MPCNIPKDNPLAIATLNRRTTPLVIPTPHRENANLQNLENHPMCQEDGQQSPEPSSGNPIQQHGTNHCGFTELPFGTGCTAAPPFWEDCNATERCEAHLANHIDSYTHRLDGLPKRTLSEHPNNLSSTSTLATQTQRDAPWREPNFPLALTVPQIWHPGKPTWQPGFQPQQAADYARQLLFQYIQNGTISRTTPEIQVHSSYTIPEPSTEQSQNGNINAQTLLTPDPHPIEHIQSPECQQQWQARPVQFSTTIKAVRTPPP